MGGAFEFVVADIDSIWTRVSASLPKEARLYESFDQSRELENIAHPGLRSAMAALSAREKRIIYLHFWCERTVTEIARELRCGVNIVEQTMEATVLKLKRQLLANQIALDLESRGASCA